MVDTNTNMHVHQNVEAEAKDNEDDFRFNKSLQELRGLRSQLHYAADYCKSTFLNAKEKNVVLDNTKEYICRAVVTVVDHLGNVSSNLELKLTTENSVSETELRLDSLHQRLFTCEQYVNKLALTKLRWNPHLPSYHPRYISRPISNLESIGKELRGLDDPTVEEVPLFLYTYNQKPSLAKTLTPNTKAKKDDTNSIKVLPVRDGLSSLSKAPNPLFHFQATSKRGRSTLIRRTLRSGNMLWLIRRTKRLTNVT